MRAFPWKSLGDRWLGGCVQPASVAGAAALLFVLIGTKLSILLRPEFTADDPLAALPGFRVALLFAIDLGVTAGALLVLGAAAALTGARRAVTPVVLALASLLVVFSLASLRIFQLFGTFLDVRLLRHAGDLTRLRSSFAAHLTGEILAWLLGAGLVAAAIFAVASRGGTRAISRRARALVVGGVAFSFAATILGFFGLRGLPSGGLKYNGVSRILRSAVQEAMARRHTRVIPELRVARAGIAPAPPPLDATSGVTCQPERGEGLRLRPGAPPRNVVYVLLESTSAAHFTRETAPRAHRLADAGAIFTNHRSPVPETFKSLYTLLTGEYPYPRPGRISSAAPDLDVFFVTEPFAADHATGLFHAGYLSYTAKDAFLRTRPIETVYDARSAIADGDLSQRILSSWGVDDRDAARAAVRFLETAAEAHRPFFLIFNPVSPHHPYRVPRGFEFFGTGDNVTRYHNSIRFVDDVLGEILDALAANGLMDETLVVIVGDHGENPALGVHMRDVTDEESRVPFIVHAPGRVAPGQRIAMQTDHADVVPTLLHLMGRKVPPDLPGRALIGALHNRLTVTFIPGREVVVFDGDCRLAVTVGRSLDAESEATPQESAYRDFASRWQRFAIDRIVHQASRGPRAPSASR